MANSLSNINRRVIDMACFIRRHVLAWLGLVLLIWPFPLGPAPFPFNIHRVSFCIGPALYKYGNGLLPGPDLFSQYGVGQGFFFAFFLGDTARQTVDNFYISYVAVNLVFFLFAYHFLARLLNSRGWAFFLCVLAFLYQFYDSEGPKFTVTPSVGLYRMPFLILVGWLFARMCRARFGLSAALGLGCALGLSVFWSTDTGMASLCACLCAAGALSRSVVRAARTAMVVIASALATFLALSVIAYGAGALTLRYLTSILAPWLWYTGGELTENFYPWDPDDGYFVALLAFISAISVIVFLAVRFRASRHRIPFAAGGLVFLGFVSLFLHAKYAVRPIFGYWAGTALPALAVMAWILKKLGPQLYRLLAARVWPARLSFLQSRRVPQILAVLTGLLCAAWLALGTKRGNTIGLRSYWGYDSLFNTAIRATLAKTALQETLSQTQPAQDFEPADNADFASKGNVALYCTEADIELIRRNTEPGERTAIVSWYDWAFLLETKRTPQYFILPVPSSIYIPSQVEQFQKVTKGLKVFFIDKRCEDFLESAYGNSRNDFYQADESDNLMLYRPRRPQVEPLPQLQSNTSEADIKYAKMVSQVQQAVRAAVPAGAPVLVVSGGDDDLVRVPGRKAGHFPQRPEGSWAGHPIDREAVAQLRAFQAKGGAYLVVPDQFAWYLKEYPEFTKNLTGEYQRIHHDEYCSIYRFSRPEPKP
jgi:hypothetical protein